MTGAVLKFARTIRLDASDGFSFAVPAKPGEWAVSGAFAFSDARPDALEGKDRIAFAQGFLGLESFGRSTFVTVCTMTEDDLAEIVERPARHFVETYGAPNLDAARPVAADEVYPTYR